MENGNLKSIRHYIFIDPNDIYCDITKHDLLNEFKSIHSAHYTTGEIVKYWGYNDIALLLKKYDEELYALFLKINHNYPSLLSDLGRFVILYYYGGVYHDLKCISESNMKNYLENDIGSNVTFIALGEHNPDDIHTRNIISLQIKHPLLHSTLQLVKKKLIEAKDNNYHGGIVAGQGSNIIYCAFQPYVDTVLDYCTKNDDVIKRREGGLYFFHHHIYAKTIARWQTTYEPIFIK